MRWSFTSEDALAAYHARSDLLAYLRKRAAEESDLEAAELIFGELVGNVVRHAPGPIAVELEWQDGLAVLRIRDFGEGFDWQEPALPRNIMAEGGRGLFLVHQLARALAIERLPDAGMRATAHLPVRLRAQ
jgi:anti-sigma regulatory factor (Ser/Thr protein kinase)